MTRFRAAGRTTKAIVVLSAVFAVAMFGLGVYALALQIVPAPTITSAPANPTNQSSASFTYTDTLPITRFECRLDGSGFSACGTTRPSTKSYPGPLTPGAHTFQVRAVFGSQTSSATSYTWTIDTVNPFAVSINGSAPNPTNAPSVSWTVTFSENVIGVGSDDFQLVNAGMLNPSIMSVSGQGSSWTVTASSGSGEGTLGLNLADNDSIRDLAGNRLGGTGAGNGNLTGQVYTLDRIAPPAPVITQRPDDPSSVAESTFAWTDAEAGVTFRCSIENGPWQACTSPITFTVDTNNNGQHQFAVQALDWVGNTASTGYSWTVSDLGFSITGNLVGQLYPGVWRPIAITIINPNHYTIFVTSLTVNVSASPAGCPASDIEFQQSALSSSHTFAVPAQSSEALPASDQPQMSLKNRPWSQDACQGGTFNLAYSGTGTK